MINLLHFALAEVDEGAAGHPDGDPAKDDPGVKATGAAAYRDYSDQVVAMVEARAAGSSGRVAPSRC